MIDFTNMPMTKKGYGGANGNKISVIYNQERYMLKFPADAPRNEELSYSNSTISEYIGCHIFKLLGIPVQETLLGTYTVAGKTKIVVACKDFTSPGIILQDFASLKNQSIISNGKGYGTELEDILYTIEEQQALDKDILSEYFWNMFIVDAFVGNWDRHNGNWGFLYDETQDTMSLAPVYDCGSCLFAQADLEKKREILGKKQELNHRVFNIPTSAIRNNGKRINYFDFISSRRNKGCNEALQRILPRIDMGKIENLIDQVPCINEIEKQFYITVLNQRKERILDYSYSLIQKEKSQEISLEQVADKVSEIAKNIRGGKSQEYFPDKDFKDR